MIDDIHKIWVEQFETPGWSYRHTGWTSHENWRQLLELIGEENVKFISGSSTSKGIRASILVSDEGLERCRKYLETDKL